MIFSRFVVFLRHPVLVVCQLISALALFGVRQCFALPLLFFLFLLLVSLPFPIPLAVGNLDGLETARQKEKQKNKSGRAKHCRTPRKQILL
jgi:hypothetical protein